MRIIVSLLLALLIAPLAAAETSWVRAGRLVDVVEGRVLSDQLIRIEDGRFTEVRPYAEGLPPSDDIIDWSDFTVLPGLMDMHTHMVGDIASSNVAAPLMSSQARDALLGAANAHATLLAGFTTVRDVGAYRAYTDVALRDAINAGNVEGPRMYVSGAYITVSRGGGEVSALSPDVVIPDEFRRGVADSADQVRQRVRELLAAGVDQIKVIATGAVLTAGTNPGAPEYSEAELRAAVDEAATRGVYVAAHAHGAEGIHRAVRAGVRSIEHGSYLDAEGIRLMRRRPVWLVADVYNGDYIDEIGRRDGWSEEVLRKNRETTQTQRDGFRAAVRAGVRIAFGTDAWVFPHGENARQFAYMVQNGMTPMQAIQSATINAAEMMGRADDIGSVRTGRRADLVAVRGDPLADVNLLYTDLVGVMKDGRVVRTP
ncbi:MAG: amidohydrolase family protein [Hyphomonadaceae bacterium JAD_PAG50586_4]|nr:MAG: amidohydrolase family protein [Hyphomonadaceae bacterium JAD_PAG50586_4]